MDLDLDCLDWNSVFDDEIASVVALAPSLPAPSPMQPALEAGVSTPRQCSPQHAASSTLSTEAQQSLKLRFGGISDEPAPGLGLPPYRALSPPFSYASTPAWGGSQFSPSPDGFAFAARREPSSSAMPEAHALPVVIASGYPASSEAPLGQEGPLKSVSKRHKSDPKEERRREQNLKDQRAYRARIKVCPTLP